MSMKTRARLQAQGDEPVHGDRVQVVARESGEVLSEGDLYAEEGKPLLVGSDSCGITMVAGYDDPLFEVRRVALG